jgi:hypothetical protein
MIDAIWGFLGGLDWGGAVLGAVVSGAFAGSWTSVRAFGRRRPLRRLLGQLSDPDLPVSVFLRDMVSVDRKYYSWNPSGHADGWQDFAVVGQADVEVAGDIANLLGRAGRRGSLKWRLLERDFELWNEPMFCVGGSPKVDKVLELCRPKLVSFSAPQTFSTCDGQTFDMSDGWDYGLIYKGRHPQTGRDTFVFFGFGVAGTRATGGFMLRHANTLASLYGDHPFAVILRARLADGKDSAEVAWMSRGVDWLTAPLHVPTMLRYRKLLFGRSAA